MKILKKCIIIIKKNTKMEAILFHFISGHVA